MPTIKLFLHLQYPLNIFNQLKQFLSKMGYNITVRSSILSTKHKYKLNNII